jgi:IS30 family transposase
MADSLNSRQRKTLDFETPSEHFSRLRSWTFPME